jgi:hypothetical protein
VLVDLLNHQEIRNSNAGSAGITQDRAGTNLAAGLISV